MPLARGGGGLEHAGLRVAVVGAVALLAILAVGLPALVPVPGKGSGRVGMLVLPDLYRCHEGSGRRLNLAPKQA